MSAISDILVGMRLTGGIFLQADFTAPWAVQAHVEPQDCSAFMQMPRQIIAYHLITKGRCNIVLETGPSAVLERGDLVILPRNTPHVLASHLDVTPISADTLIDMNVDEGLAHLSFGGGGERAQLLCGFLGSALENRALTVMLPEMLTLHMEHCGAASWIESTIRYAIHEWHSHQTDSSAAIAKLAEILFLEAVRRYFALNPQASRAAIAGMHDPFVGRALALLQNRMYEPWTTERLARDVGLSRSSFADRFTRELGETPMSYLTRVRLEAASLRLLDDAVAVACIAYESGYGSESAFSRAFRRMYGAPPAAWRRNMLASRPPAEPES